MWWIFDACLYLLFTLGALTTLDHLLPLMYRLFTRTLTAAQVELSMFAWLNYSMTCRRRTIGGYLNAIVERTSSVALRRQSCLCRRT